MSIKHLDLINKIIRKDIDLIKNNQDSELLPIPLNEAKKLQDYYKILSADKDQEMEKEQKLYIILETLKELELTPSEKKELIELIKGKK